MDKEEALFYLKNRGIQVERAAKSYELVGGRLVNLGYAPSSVTQSGLDLSPGACGGPRTSINKIGF